MDKQPRKIIFGAKVQKSIDTGVTMVYKAVATTLGSKGRNVSIEKNWGVPLIVHDGVTVAREVILSDQFANQAAQQVIAAAQKTNDQAGDGTTTATILTYAIVKEGLKQIAAGIPPTTIRNGIKKAEKLVVDELLKIAKPVNSFEEMLQVASISAASPEIGKTIATAVQKVGRHGVVTVQEGNGSSIEVEYKEGMEFGQGYISSYMINNAEREEMILKGNSDSKRPFIVIVDEEINNDTIIKVLKPIVEYDQSAQIIVIANDFDGDSRATLVLNRLQANKLYVGVKSPEHGDHRTALLMDIATVTGATVIGGNTGVKVESATVDHAGRADKVIVTKDQTMIIGGQGKKENIDAQVKAIKHKLTLAKTEFERDKLEARLAKLVGGVAVISVGANSQAETRELKERVYDAVNATKAAIEQGIVPGGGVAMVRVCGAIEAVTNEVIIAKTKKAKSAITAEDLTGINIVKDALIYPLKKLVQNAGGKPDYVLQKVFDSGENDLGYNVDTEQFENMVVSGIIDPVKVTISAFKNAASTAAMLLTTECMIGLQREKQSKPDDDMEGIGSFSD